jgi:hypothetical protein
VAHKEFLPLFNQKVGTQVIFDVKGILNKKFVDARL